MKSKVYFLKVISPENVVEMYKVLNKELTGNVAVKVHSGEKGNQNFLKPEFLKNIIEYVNGTVVECNTAYIGKRETTKKHMKLIVGVAKTTSVLFLLGNTAVLHFPDFLSL